MPDLSFKMQQIQFHSAPPHPQLDLGEGEGKREKRGRKDESEKGGR